MAKFVLLLAVVAVLVMAATSAPRKRRVTEEEALTPLDRFNTTTPEVVCSPSTPCGWTVYTPFTKDVEYFMANNYCKCAPDTECSYYDDDISNSAFVHRCQPPMNATTEVPTTTESLIS